VTASPEPTGDSAADDLAAADRVRLRAALPALPRLGRTVPDLRPLPGGLTNHNYRVSLPTGGAAVVRMSTDSDSVLAIDRCAEFRNATTAAQQGVGPQVLGCDPDAGISVVRWIEGRTLGPADLDDSVRLQRIAQTCRRLHSGPRFGNDFDMTAVLDRYLGVVRSRGYRLPSTYLDFLPIAEDVSAALSVRRPRRAPCHNDLLPANILDDGARIWFIDYEYSGNNDPYFELGNLWSEAELPPARLPELVSYYVGAESREYTARARLWAALARYGWTLWASIQHAVSPVDFDFWSWGRAKYELAIAEFRGAELPQLLQDVTSSR
jgi:thiamine kinase-like enzyme